LKQITQAGCLALVFGALAAAPADAQMTWTDKAFVNVNFGVQGGSDTLSTAAVFDLYGEPGSVATTQEVGGGGLFDLSAGYKVWRNLAVGIAYSRTGSDADVAVAATVPHPVFFDQARTLSGTLSGLDHTENAVHLQGTWVMPVTDVFDVSFSFGPTIFNVSQEIPTGTSAPTVSEPNPAIGEVVVTGKEKKSTVGFHLGADANYFFTDRIGAGVLLRYAWGSVDFDSADDSTGVGGLQFGVGVRVRF
jgi:hypothetical protein